MKFSHIVLSLFLITNTYFANAQETDPTQAPKANLVVTLNGKEYKISEGEELKKDGNTISVKFADYKTFDSGSIRFEYPTHFSFEYESDIGYQNWSLNGNNFVIMYFELAAGNLDNFVEEIAGQFGRNNCKISKTSMTLGNRTLQGKHINVGLVGEQLSLDLFEVKMSDGKTRILVFQDSLDDDGYPTDEGQRAIAKLKKTITYRE